MDYVEEIRKKGLWLTKEGKEMRICDMDTNHVFNAMKMLYNHIAKNYGMPYVQFTHYYDGQDKLAVYHSEKVLLWLGALLTELRDRTDLPAHCRQPYEEIVRNLWKALKEYAKKYLK